MSDVSCAIRYILQVSVPDAQLWLENQLQIMEKFMQNASSA